MNKSNNNLNQTKSGGVLPNQVGVSSSSRSASGSFNNGGVKMLHPRTELHMLIREMEKEKKETANVSIHLLKNLQLNIQAKSDQLSAFKNKIDKIDGFLEDENENADYNDGFFDGVYEGIKKIIAS